MYVNDDDLNTPLETDNLPLRDEAGRFIAAAETDDARSSDAPVAETGELPADAPPADPPAADEPAGEVSADGEQPPAAAPEPVPDEDKLKNQKVPYGRFKEAVSKEREKREAAERELASLREQLQSTPDVDVTEEELDSLGNLLIEGKTTDYAKGMKGLLEKVFLKGVETATERAQAVTRIESAEDRVVRERVEAAARWTAEYPVFDPSSPEFDEDMLDEARALRDAYESRGMSPAAAIERAVKRLVGDKVVAVPAPAPAPRPSTVGQKLEIAAAQPPRSNGSGEPDKPTTLLSSIANMTDEEFDRLSEADLEKLRRGIRI